MGHLWILLPSKETKSLLLLLPPTSLQEPEEKKIVRELLETEQAYVARLHLLDQASGQGAPRPIPWHLGVLTLTLLSFLAHLIRAES